MENVHEMKEKPSDNLTQLLTAARVLSGSDNKKNPGQKDLDSVLRTRLSALKDVQVKQLELTDRYLDTLDTEALQYQTASTAFILLEEIYKEGQSNGSTTLSLNDQSAIRRLVALISRWKITVELEEYNKTSSSSRNVALEKLLESIKTIIRWADPSQANSSITVVGTSVIQCLVDFLPALFTVGWATQCPDASSIRASTLRLLQRSPLSENMQLLGTTLSNPQVPPAAKRSIKILLGRLILRPKGVSALLEMIFGSEDHGGDMLSRYEQTAALLSTPPGGMPIEEYSRAIIPQLLDILSQKDMSATHQRAISFAIARILSSQNHEATKSILYSILYDAFAPNAPPDTAYTPLQAMSIASTLLATAPPSADKPLASTLLDPIVEKLYALLYYLESRAVSDPAEIAECKGLLHSWTKVSPIEIVCDKLWNIVQGQGGEWTLSDVGEELRLGWHPLGELEAPKLGDLSNLEEHAMEGNPLNLRPDPIHLVGFIQSIKRDEVQSLFFIRLLASKHDHEDNPMNQLLRIQLLYQLQKQAPSAILSNPEHALAFVDHVLDTGTNDPIDSNPDTLGPLKFLKSESPHQDEQNDELLHTAIDYLLSCLEANPTFVPSTTGPHLANVSKSLKTLGTHPSKPVRQVAREASLVLLARQSHANLTSSEKGGKENVVRSSHETYQEALVLLQDPLLPVRAQGLAILRQLVQTSNLPTFDAALVPGILDIFINSVQEEDSFIFLNAVQGLAAMVQNFGKDVFRRLCDIYVTEPHASSLMNRQELDVKLRVGEALADVVGKCGQALGGYVDILMPVILATLRDNGLPTTLRTSAISIASQCIDTSPFAMGRYSAELSGAMLDILELEHSLLVESKDRRPRREETEGVNGEEEGNDTISGNNVGRPKAQIGDLMTDEEPTANNAKLSPLRRAAIHLLSSIIRHFLQDGSETLEFPVRRTRVILRYLGVHDADAVVNAMASEAVGMLLEVGRLRLGLDS